MPHDPTTHATLIQTLWKLGEDRGLPGFTIDMILAHVSIEHAYLRHWVSSPEDCILILFSSVTDPIFKYCDAQDPPPVNDDTEIQDFIFDAVMQAFDAAQPYKKAIARLHQDVLASPATLIKIIPYIQRFIRRIVKKSYANHSKITRFSATTAYSIGLYWVFLCWLKDDTFEQDETLAHLDKLSKNVTWGLQKLGFSPAL